MLVLGRTIAAREQDGALYVSVDSLCETLDISAPREIRRIITDLMLAPEVRYLPFPCLGGMEIRLTLPAHAFLAWVARLDAKRVKNPVLKERLLAAQQSLCRPGAEPVRPHTITIPSGLDTPPPSL
jgi:hypothetical protein